jgi:hypothetical protein
MSNAFLDHGLRTIELGVQLSQVFHLVHPSDQVPDYQKRGAAVVVPPIAFIQVVRSLLGHNRVSGSGFHRG